MYKFKLNSFFALFLLASSSDVLAFKNILELNNEINFKPKEKQSYAFIFSTELDLARAKPILEKAPPGLLITLGSERGFNAAAIATKATHILMVDYNEDIIRYNQINLKLLKANNLKQYRNLRWDASLEDWIKFGLNEQDFLWWKNNVREKKGSWDNLSENLSRYGKDIFFERFTTIYNALASYKDKNLPREILLYPDNFLVWQSKQINLSEDDFKWWHDNIVLHRREFQPWTLRGSTLVGAPDDLQFIFDWGTIFENQAGNFIVNEGLYNRLHKLAINNKIAVCHMDLSNKEHINKLFVAIEKSKIPISLLDLDNTWFYKYLGDADYNNLIKQLLPLGKDNSILMVMYVSEAIKYFDYQYYLGFFFSNIKTWDKNFRMSSFLAQAKDIIPLLHGRVFTNMPRWRKLDF